MNVNKASLFWGILLIGGGAVALAQQFGYLDQLPESAWMWVFALVSLAAFLSYALSGWREWGWLFPAGVFGGLAVTIGLATNNVDNAAVGSPLFFGLLIPFVAAYLTDRSKNWWALIPGGVMLFLAMTTLLVDNVGGEWVGSLFLFLIGLSFLVVYLNNRTRLWALLVAYIMGVLSLAPAMASGGGDTAAYFGSVFLFAVALPFFILYFRSAEYWWAIIPAGVMTVLALIAGAAIAGWIRNANQGGYANAFLMGGLAVTFAVVWLRHAKDWAKVVAIVLAGLAIASIFFVSYYEMFWPVAIILVGAYLLYTAMRPKAVH
ncbi:MAG TPA: hypothetical protein VFR47_13790 [Anaerolineales bacterium]|nr:hypothetical protein [Anaerolineales bacterium]